MIETILEGISTGFIFSWTFGTVFFLLIQASIEFGYKKGLIIATGVVFSDALCITIAVFGTTLIPGIDRQQANIGFLGGILLLGLGAWMFFKKHVTLKMPQTKFGSLMFFFSTGIFLNLVNPINFFSWVYVSIVIHPAVSYSPFNNFIFYSCALGTIFLCESFISYSAHSFKKIFTVNLMKVVDYISGCVFIGIGIYLLIHHYDKFLK